MAKHIIVVDRPKDFKWPDPAYEVTTPREFITRPPAAGPNVRVINLCGDTSYLSLGYYCSLLAEARGQRVIPSVEVLLELNWKRLYMSANAELEAEFGKALERGERGEVRTHYFFFGRSPDERLKEVGRRLFDLFRSPILAVELRFRRDWQIKAMGTVSLREVPAALEAAFADGLTRYTKTRWTTPQPKAVAKYTLAILHDPEEALPPSGKRALDKFVEVGKKLSVDCELITRKDFGKLAEFDALFIRETTRLDHHTYRFARKAEAEGMPVMDDPGSILRCTNKVYLAELLQAKKLPTPKTVILDKETLLEAEKTIGFPVVIKIPDGSFSRGVHKAENREELVRLGQELLKHSDVILAQEFMYTEHDWRVGVLNRKPLFVSQYMMARKHWQIVQHKADGKFAEGSHKTWAVANAPPAVVDLALKAADLMGDGLYGVDLKESDGKVFVIEVNDNPNIDAGVEDQVLKDELYAIVLNDFIRRIEGREARRIGAKLEGAATGKASSGEAAAPAAAAANGARATASQAKTG